MVSIINKATNIILKKGRILTEQIVGIRQRSLPNQTAPASSSDDLANFFSLFGVKGKYALFVLIVFLTSQLKAQNINTPNKIGPMGTQVNSFTGNLVVLRNDTYIPARGIDLDISFVYNAFDYNQNRGFGNGWSFTYSKGYRLDSAGAVTIIQGDNREDLYTPTTGGAFIPTSGIFDSLSQYQTGKYLLQTKFGTKYYFDNSTHKRVTKILDPNGNYLTFGYKDSLVTSITNAAGQSITLTYNGAFLATVVDAITSPTHTYNYTYDGYGNLIQVLDPAANKTVYAYLVNGPMKSTTDKNGNTADIIYFPDFTVSELISCNGRKSFSYDSTAKTTVVTDYIPTSTNQVTTYKYKTYNIGNVTKAWLTHITGNCCGYNMDFSYDNAGNLLTRTDANGNIYTYTYDNNGNILTITDPLGNRSSYTYTSQYNHVTAYTDAKGNSYAINYDNAGNPTQITEPGNLQASFTYSAQGDILSGTDPNGNSYHFAYDAYGYPAQVLEPLSTTIGFAFDARGNMISTTNPNGNITGIQYDVLNRPTTVKDALNNNSSIAYDANGNIHTISDANGHITTLIYDASNRIVGVTDAAGKQVQYIYDAMGNVIQYKDELGKPTSFGYDNLNRLIAVTDALGNGYSFGYDNSGNMLAATMPTGNTISYVYDKLNRPISGSDGVGTLGTLTYDKNGNVASYTNGTNATVSILYDGLDRVTKVIDPLGNARSFNYDNNNNVTSSTDRNGNTLHYTYDALNRPNALTDNNGNKTNVTYDAFGYVLTAKDANSNATTYQYDVLERMTTATFPNSSAIHFGYDNAGNLSSKQLSDGSTISYQYDALNRMTSKILPGNNIYSYTYDGKGRITNATNAVGTISIAYDDINRVLTETLNGHTTTYAYNTAARTKTFTYPDGNSITWDFDLRNRLDSINKGITNIANYQYNNANQTQQLAYANGTVTNWQYDAANHLTNISTQASSLPHLTYTYDKEWNKLSVARPNFPQASEQYGYDAGYRLTNFTQGTTPNTYTYDALGNRTVANLNGTTNTYTANNLNQYTSLKVGSNTINFTHDGNGNLTYDGNFGKRYDAEGKLLVDSNTNNKLVYTYDAFGRRVQKSINGTAINYYYAGIMQLEQRNAATDKVLNETVFSTALNPVSVGVNHSNYYYHQNDLNSVEAISDANGNLVERYQYDAYGNQNIYDASGNALITSSIGNRFAFTGQEYDAETKSYHFHFRNYSSTTGSFHQRDPLGYTDGMGMYQYVHDNPANGIDLLGLECPPTPSQPPVSAPSITDVADATSTATGITSIASLAPSLSKSILTSSSVSAVLAPLTVVATAQSAVDLGNNYKSQNYIQNTDQATGIVMNSTGLGITGYVIATGATIAAAPEVLVTGASLALYSATNSVSKSLTNKTLPEQLFPITDGVMSIGGQYKYARDFQEQYDYHKSLGEENLQKWLAAYRKSQRIAANYYRNHQNDDPCPPNNNNHGTQKPSPITAAILGGIVGTTVINSLDPNEIIGPTGVGKPQFVNAVDQMPYTINFENSVNASAPAKTVRINYPVDPKQDLNNISLGSFGFNNLTFNIPAKMASYYQRLDARDSLGLYIDITAGLDVNNHQIFWVFQSIDPVTLLTPTDPLKGFLLLTDTSKPTSGHGFVNFFIKPLSGDITGDTTHATASIVFDGNDTVPTNVAKNTIDAGAPTSHVNALPTNSPSTVVPLSWTANDDAKGSGVKSYSLYVAVNNGAFGLYATNISRKDTTFTGASGNRYSFFVLSTDSVGNTETLKPGAEATTYINAMVLPVTWLYFNAINHDKDALLSWATATETNTKSFEVERSIDGRNFSTIGNVAAAGNSAVQSNYTYIDKNVVSLNIPVVYYRLKQIDKDGKATYSNVVAVQLPMVTVGPIVQAYPNPFKQTLNILIANMTALDLSDNIAIYTLEGRIVYEKSIGQRLLNSTITLTDLPSLTPGMYILKLGLNRQSYSFKLMKQ